MADNELHSQMVKLGHHNVGFAHGTATSLYNGSILRNARDKPSNLSFFTLYENNPLCKSQTSRYLSLNILANNVENKNINKIKASQKQVVTLAKDYPELINVIKMYRRMASILFGEESALVVEIRRAIGLIKQEVSTIKVRIAGDFRYPAKILYAFKICIQHWLCLYEKQEDQLTINDRIIDLDQVIEQILNSSLTIDLPTVFVNDATNSAQKTEGETPTPAGAGQQQQQGGEKRSKKCKGGSNNGAAGRHIKNKKHGQRIQDKGGQKLASRLSWKTPKGQTQMGREQLDVRQVVHQGRLLL